MSESGEEELEKQRTQRINRKPIKASISLKKPKEYPDSR